jgi:hypothetical protein
MLMKRLVLAVSLVFGTMSLAAAQTPPRRVQAPTTRFSIDSTISALIAHPLARAALDRHLPGLSGHPRLSEFRQMTLRALAASPHARIATAKVQALQAELARIR